MNTGAGKKAQRTKGNVKPSSSSKAAEMLTASGIGVSSSAGFIGFGLNPGGVDDEFDQELDPDFRVAFRKLVKKETTTKIKALKELQELIEKSDEKSVLIAWQCWPRLYSKVSLDADFKVREESHKVLDCFFRKLGRQIAAQLKSVMPFWLLGEHDPYPLAAASAKCSLQSAFPLGKRLQALKFCKESLINEFADILYGERNYKPEILSSKSDAEFETNAEMKTNRLCCCSLLAASTLLSELPDEDCSTSADMVKEKFLNQTKFWNVGKSKISTIKNSWIKFISVVICKLPDVSKLYAGQISPIVVNNMDRQTMDVCRSSWDAILLCLETFPEEFWIGVNFQKAFFPKISSILRKGGDGVASAVCPALLPVLSKLSTSNVADLNHTYAKFMSNFEQGIRISNEPKFDAVERISFFRSYADCLKFVVVQLIKEKEILNQILNEQFYSIFVLCLSSEIISKQKDIYSIFVDLISFVVNLRKKRGDDVDADLLTKFVSIVSNWIKNSIRTNLHTDAIRSLLVETTKRNECRQILADICKNCWESYVVDSMMVHCLRLLNDVVRSGGESTTFIARTDPEIDSIELESCVKIVFEKDLSSSVDVEECTLLVSLIFSVWNRLDGRCRSEFLQKLLELKSSSMRYAFLTQMVEIFDDIPHEVVRSAQFRDLFLICFAEMTDKIAHGERSSYDWQVFVRILCSKRDEKILLSSLVDAILDDLLRLIRKKPIDRAVLYLVARIASTLFTSSNDIATSTLARDLVLALFDLYSSDFLPNDLLETLHQTWILALAPNVTSTGGFLNENSLIVKMAKRLTDRLLEQNLNQNSLNRLIDVAKSLLIEFDRLLTADGDGSSKKLNDSSISFICFLLPSKQNWSRLIDDVTLNDSSWKINSQFEKTTPIYEFFEENFNEIETKKSLEHLIQVVAYSLRFYRIVSSTFDDEEIFKIFADSFSASTAFVIFLTNLRRFFDSTWIVRSFDEIFNKSSHVVIEEFSCLIDVLKPNVDSLLRSCFAFASSTSSSTDLWKLLINQLISDFDVSEKKLETLIDSSPIVDKIRQNIFKKSLDLDQFSTYVDEKCLNKLTEFFFSASDRKFFQSKLNMLNYFVQNQSLYDDVLLFNRDVSASSMDVAHFNVALIRFLDSLVENLSDLTSDAQDFIFCSVLAWLQSCFETKRFDVPCSTFAVTVVQLFNKISVKFTSPSIDFANRDENKTYVDDWNEFFSNGCEAILVPYFVELCDKNLQKLSGYVCCEVASALAYVDEEKLLDSDLPLLLSPDLDALNYPQKLQSIILHLFPLLIAERRRSVQIGAYNVLKKIVHKLNEYETQTSSDDSDEVQTREIPSYFLSPLKTSYDRWHEISSTSHNDDKHEILYSNVLSFFLVWKLLIKFFNALKTDDRPLYSNYLRNSRLLDEFLTTVFSFVSSDDEPQFRTKNDESSSMDGDGKIIRKIVETFLNKNDDDFRVNGDKTDYFTNSPPLDPKTSGTLAELRHLACNVYFEALCSFPAAVRQWFNNLDRKTKFTVERFTSKFISPIICLYELENISKSQKEYDKMKLTTRPKANQIVANYSIEDLKMDLIVTLPSNYPLAQVCVEAPERVAVSNDKWRSWMFQLITCQNGSLLDGLFLWKRCVDKHLEGVEDCTICMMSVHGSSYKLPKVTCRQCKKKFHAECLRKWFETSNNANCPLCRTEFSS